VDPMDSPAHHARSLTISSPHIITAADADTILTFCGVVHLNVDTDLWYDQMVSLVPLHGLFPVLRSLNLTFNFLPDSEIFSFICTLPLLEDLALVSHSCGGRMVEWNVPSTSPRLTGYLDLRTDEGIQSITRRLSDLPNGIRFTTIAVPWFSKDDILSTTNLVLGCSGTLESLDITNRLPGVLPWPLYLIDTLPCTRRVQDTNARPLQSNNAPRYSIPVQKSVSPMDHHGAPHHRIKNHPTDHIGYISLLPLGIL